jgi:enamine deaminase RidA (YjgF/YER057c/UK114 family)
MKYNYYILFLILFNVVNLSIVAQNENALKNVNTILEKAFDDDQNIRDSIIVLQKSNDINTAEYRNLSEKMNQLDSINQLRVFPILDKYGWLGKPTVS